MTDRIPEARGSEPLRPHVRYRELVNQALERLAQAHDLPAEQLLKKLDEAEAAVVTLRDELIVRLRQEPVMPATAPLRRMLEQVNTALSLIVGVEYPSAGLHRRLMGQAGDLLRSLSSP